MADIYDVALSYASEQREYVQAVAAALRRMDIVCFYDEYEQATIWGEDLRSRLHDVYGNKSRFTVIFVSQAYSQKLWTNLEQKAAKRAAAELGRTYVLPARFDDTKLSGVDPNRVFIDLRNTAPEELAKLIQGKLAASPDALPAFLQKTLLRKLLDLSWPAVLLLGMIPGAALLAWSALLGVLDLQYPMNEPDARQVGYGWALNWSIGFTLMFPIAAALLVAALDEIKRLFHNLDARKMFVRTSAWLKPDSPGDALRVAWLRGNKLRRVVVSIGIVFFFAISLVEWFRNNFLRLYWDKPVDGINDIDWGLACKFLEPPCTWLQRLSNVGLDLLAFLTQGFYLAVLFIFLVYVVDFVCVLDRQAKRYEIEFWPALLDPDRRRGFEEFEPLLNRLLLITLVGYVIGYLVRIENLYLTSAIGYEPARLTSAGLLEIKEIPAHSVWEFIRQDFADYVHSVSLHEGSIELIRSGIANLFRVDGWTYHTGGSGAGTFFIFIVTVCIVLTTIRTLAGRAKANAKHYYENAEAKPRFGLTLDEERKLVNGMEVWPIRYLRFNVLLAWTLIAVVSLIWHRIGALVFIVIVIYLICRALGALLWPRRENPVGSE